MRMLVCIIIALDWTATWQRCRWPLSVSANFHIKLGTSFGTCLSSCFYANWRWINIFFLSHARDMKVWDLNQFCATYQYYIIQYYRTEFLGNILFFTLLEWWSYLTGRENEQIPDITIKLMNMYFSGTHHKALFADKTKQGQTDCELIQISYGESSLKYPCLHIFPFLITSFRSVVWLGITVW